MSAFNKSDDITQDERDAVAQRNRNAVKASENPGLFAGATELWKLPVSGGAKIVGGFESLFNVPGKVNEIYAGVAYNLTPGAYGENADEAGKLYQDRMRWSNDLERENRAWAAEYYRQSDAYYQNPQGEGTQVIRAVGEIIPRAILGNKFGLAGSAFSVGIPEGGATETRLADQGVAPDVAAQAGDITAVTFAGMSLFPAARLSNSMMADLGLVVGGNVAMGAGQRELLSQVLSDTPEIAKQYEATDSTAIAMDALLAVPFWGLARMGGGDVSPQQKVEIVDRALTMKANEQANAMDGKAPATPKDTRAVRQNKAAGIEAILNDKPMPDPAPVNAVDVPEAAIEKQAFADSIAEAIRTGDVTGIRLIEGVPPSFGGVLAERGASFDSAVANVLDSEGGYVNDPVDRGGETKFGISRNANPGVDIANLTKDQAKAIYKAKYWDEIGADSLPPALREMAFDAAVNQGVGFTKEALAKAGNDPAKFMQLRRDRYADIIRNDPSQAKYQKGWENRLARLESGGKQADTYPNGVPKNLPEVEADVREVNTEFSRFTAQGADGSVRSHRGVRAVDQGSLPNELAASLQAIDEALGVKTTVVRNLSPEVRDFHGTTLGDGRIFVNENSAHPLVTVAMHEFGHNLEIKHPDLYEPLRAEIERQSKDGGLDFFKADTKQANDATAVRELTNNAIGDALTDPKFLRRMADENPTAFQKLATTVMEYLDKLLAKVGLKDYGSDRYLWDVAVFRDLLASTMTEYNARTVGFDEKGAVLSYADEIGWEQVGGRLVGKSGMDEGMTGQGGGFQVSGRSTWIPKAARNGKRSQFWSNRPEGISEATARKALDKFRDGKKLGAAEQRFIDYAKQAAKADEADRQAAFADFMESEANRRELAFSDKLDDGFDVPPDASAEEVAAYRMAQTMPKAQVEFGYDLDGNPIKTVGEAVQVIEKLKIEDMNKAKRFGQVVERVVAGKTLTDAEAKVSDTIAAKYRDMEKAGDKAFLEMSKYERLQYSAEMAGKEAEILAAKAAQRRAASLLAQTENLQRVLDRAPNMKPGLLDKYVFGKQHVTDAVFERLGQIFSRIQGEQHAARASFMEALEATSPKFFGLIRNTEGMLAFAREVLGEDSGLPEAKKAARVYLDSIEAMRVRANSLGMNIGKLPYGWLPHQWDQGMIAHGGRSLAERAAAKAKGETYTPADARDGFVKDMLEHTDLTALRNEDGTVMDLQDATAFYESSFDTLFSDGRNKGEVGGRGTRASKYDGKHRVIHFKNAESYMAMMDKYGGGRDLMQAIMGHMDAMAKDIAMLDEFGANPAQTFELLKSTAERIDNKPGATSQGATLDMVFSVLNGEVSTPVNSTIASFHQGVRNWVTATALQGVMIASVTDAPLQQLVLKSYGMDMGKGLKTTMGAFGGDTAKEAAKLGIVTDYLANEMALWGQDNAASSVTGKLAEATMRLTGVNRWTHSMRRGAELQIAMGVTDWIGTPWAGLEAKTIENLTQSGVTEADWVVWQKATASEFKGQKILDYKNIMAVDDPNATRAAMRYLGFLDDVGKLAVYAPDAKVRAALTQGSKSGTHGGELMRDLTLFKSFALGMPLRHLRRMRQMDGKSKAQYSAAYIIGLTVFGAISLQLKQLASGKDPVDMTEGKFWATSLAQGGGLGILYDVIYKGVEAEGRTGRQNWRSLSSPVFGRAADTIEVGMEGIMVAGGSQKHEKQFREHAARFVSDNTPFTKIWWYKEAFNQILGHEMRETISPGYVQKERARAAKYSESYYIKPNGDTRAPDFEKAVGE